jgi:ATP synthase, delta/epsilon subunit, beta-sandwich domain protein
MIVEILSPEALLFKGEVTAVNVPGAKEPFVILDHHAPIISMLTAGEVTLFEGKKELKSFTISGGTLECNHNKVVILAD